MAAIALPSDFAAGPCLVQICPYPRFRDCMPRFQDTLWVKARVVRPIRLSGASNGGLGRDPAARGLVDSRIRPTLVVFPIKSRETGTLAARAERLVRSGLSSVIMWKFCEKRSQTGDLSRPFYGRQKTSF